MGWVKTKNLVKLDNEFDELGPERDKSSDGSVGDLAHQSGTSGHNPDKTGNAEYKDGDDKDEVRAIDVDKSGPWLYGQTMEKAIQHLVTQARKAHAAGAYYPLQYIIYNRRIWSKSDGWVTREYTGPNPHDKHAHYSGARSQRADEDSTFNYGIATLGKPEDDFMFIENQTQFNTAMNTYFASSDSVGDAVLRTVVGHPVWPNRRLKSLVFDLWGVRDSEVGDKAGNVGPDTPYGKLLSLPPLLMEALANEAARDAQDAARDAATLASLDAIVQLLNTTGNGATMTDAQFAELKTAVLEKVVEAGQDAVDVVQERLRRLGEALDNAGEALSGVEAGE